MSTKPPTIKQRRAVEDTLANLTRAKPKTKKAILKDAGYSTAVSTQPHLVLESKGFLELLAENLPEDLVTQRHQELLNSGIINEYEFFAKEIMGEEEKDDEDFDATEDEKHIKPYKGRKQQSYRKIKKRVPIDDDAIKSIIESVPGCKIIYIKHYSTGTKVAYFFQPDNRSRKDAIDLAYKLRGSYAPEKSLNVNVNHIGSKNPRIKKVVKQFEVNLKKALLEKPNE